jgi:hypothetical protein
MSYSYNDEEINPFWSLSDEFTVEIAAALIAGYDPGYIDLCNRDTNFAQNFPNLYPAREALCKAIIAGKLKASIRYSAREYGYADAIYDMEANEALLETGYGRTANYDEVLSDDLKFFYHPYPDWNETTIYRDDLISWLSSRGFKSVFFFPDAKATDEPDYLNKKHPRYSGKLAAAVSAWEALKESKPQSGKSPKQALEKWLKENAARFGLTDDDGNPVTTAMTECSTIANWSNGASW